MQEEEHGSQNILLRIFIAQFSMLIMGIQREFSRSLPVGSLDNKLRHFVLRWDSSIVTINQSPDRRIIFRAHCDQDRNLEVVTTLSLNAERRIVLHQIHLMHSSQNETVPVWETTFTVREGMAGSDFEAMYDEIDKRPTDSIGTIPKFE